MDNQYSYIADAIHEEAKIAEEGMKGNMTRALYGVLMSVHLLVGEMMGEYNKIKRREES